MIHNINNFGTINYYESNHRQQPSRPTQVEDVTPIQEDKPTYTPPFPKKGDYNAVREYVEERKKYDEVFREYCKTHNRTQLCERLSDEFGWEVSVDSYGKNVNRNH